MDGRRMAPKKITSLDVARRAGVSQSAVSRVFTPGASVSPGMAAKVKQAAEELGYRPNVLARSLITGNSRMIGVVVAYLKTTFIRACSKSCLMPCKSGVIMSSCSCPNPQTILIP